MVCMIALIWVNNLADFNHYRDQVPASFEPYGGEIRFGVEEPMTLVDENGLGNFSRIALFWFLTAKAITDCYESDAYQELSEPSSGAITFTIIGTYPELKCA